MTAEELSEVDLQARAVVVGERGAGLLQDADGVVGALLGDRQREVEHVVAHPVPESGDHPEVDEDERILGEQDVARMRVGVHETVDEDLVDVGADEFVGEG